jgi:tetratricopeptide (TPR) repeat protein
MKALAITVILLSSLLLLLPVTSAHRERIGAMNSGPSATPGRVSSRTEGLLKGETNEKVVCKADATQSYALYLPSNYTPDKKWPILYCFDPGAQGSFPVERFKASAEKYGWIIVGSNNSQNGPLKPSIEASSAVWTDTHARFNIDEKRTYTSGFSGGARVAIWVAYLCDGCVAGVIACGAGFHRQITLSPALPFVVFSTVGFDDYNFPEMKALDDSLAKFGIEHRLELFDGKHEWLTADLTTRGLEWLELKAMKAGLRAKDEAIVTGIWNKRLDEARRGEESKQFYQAYRMYEAMANGFAGLRETSEITTKLNQLKETSEVKDAVKEEREQISKQQSLAVHLNNLLGQRNDSDPDLRFRAVGDFKKKIADLKKESHGPKDTSERRVARRVLFDVFAQFYEGGSNLLLRQTNYPEAIYDFEIAAEIAPDNPEVLYSLASAYSLAGQKKKALSTLKTAVEKGFKSVQRLIDDKAFDPIRNENGYKEILTTLGR